MSVCVCVAVCVAVCAVFVVYCVCCVCVCVCLAVCLAACLAVCMAHSHMPRRTSVTQEMIQEADRDGDGVINADEFYRVMKKRSANPLDDLDSDDD